MKRLLQKLSIIPHSKLQEKLENEQAVRRQVTALFGILSHIYGADKLVLRAGKLDAVSLMRSNVLEERVLALQRIVFENANLQEKPAFEQIPDILNQIEEHLADMIARRAVEEDLEIKVAQRMQDKHDEYIREVRSQIVKENNGPENAQTLKKFAQLEKLEQTKLSRSTYELLRPQSFGEMVGQKQQIRALVSKLASPYPQHILIYGPPGVGKTTAARIALQEACKIKGSVFHSDAPFVEVDGTTLRWDPRDMTNPLLGSVHDPIYQGAKRDLADSATPEPKLGLVTDAHGGVLFIDEIGELDLMLQNKLLKVLEDKRVHFESPYFDPDDKNVPQYIRKLFEEGAPADFILIGATTRDPSEVNPALRSRCAEIYFEPLIPQQIEQIANGAAQKLGVALEHGVAEMISRYTIEGRKAVNVLADAYGIALYQLQGQKETECESVAVTIRKADVQEVLRVSRLVPYRNAKKSSNSKIGKIHGLGVAGFLGSVIEIEAVVYKAKDAGKGRIRFNDTAGSMAKDSVFNAVSVIRSITGIDLSDYDVHVNVIGGGKIDGPSAGVAIFLAIYSALMQKPIPQHIAVTGEVSIQGFVKPVGGVVEKIFGARQAEITQVIVPFDNAADIPAGLSDIDVTTAITVEDVLQFVFEKNTIDDERMFVS
ncbi:Lon family ATP-dependent protease [Fodinisporobacter ferrooxydans]|uniref:endopeptidase La n=1 Tax=Fodinisporobacter ferrooxydans TaxID=2901836 RepID=A0ABY4CMJ4_9BACL|nr:Lon family ATP-dependent protease [Alicyclobacillaceae bacterium MYW30-H2]